MKSPNQKDYLNQKVMTQSHTLISKKCFRVECKLSAVVDRKNTKLLKIRDKPKLN